MRSSLPAREVPNPRRVFMASRAMVEPIMPGMAPSTGITSVSASVSIVQINRVDIEVS